jgi:hypothetical protein
LQWIGAHKDVSVYFVAMVKVYTIVMGRKTAVAKFHTKDISGITHAPTKNFPKLNALRDKATQSFVRENV